RNLRTELGMGLLIISHDIGVVYQLVDFIAVMYAGRLVEMGPTDAVIKAPAHPYTQALISVLPARGQPKSNELNTIPGHLEPAAIGDTGCPFRARCAYAQEVCSVEFPEPVRVGVDHTSYCWFSADQMGPERAGGDRQ